MTPAKTKTRMALWRALQRLADRRGSFGRAMRAAKAAGQQGQWADRARALTVAIELRPDRTALRVQLAHALKETGDDVGARRNYEQAAEEMRDDVDVRIHLAMMLRRMGEANAATERYREILEIDPFHAFAVEALIESGARENLPVPAYDRQSETIRTSRLARLRQELRIEEHRAIQAGYPLSRYDLFRQRYPLTAPPLWQPINTGCVVVVLATAAHPAALRATFAALRRQELCSYGVLVVAGQDLLDHPVLSTVRNGNCFRNVTELLNHEAISGRAILVVAAGAVIACHGLSWLRFAADRTGADAVYGDHDRVNADWRNAPSYSDPRFFSAHDPLELSHTQAPPISVLVSESLLRRVACEDAGAETLLRRLVTGATVGVHVPRRIASLYALPANAAAAPEAAAAITLLSHTAPQGLSRILPLGSPIGNLTVVIPVRDNGRMLLDMVNSLFAKARTPERLRIIIVDNRSVEPETKTVFETLMSRGTSVVSFDEPFNWSRANNLAAASVRDGCLVFANNDMKMISQDWDVMVQNALHDRSVGVLGARLHYQDGSYQHVGIAVANGPRCPFVHEGIGRAGDDPGPSCRWRTSRRAAAVTGAFMAMRSDTWRKVGGFEENLAIAYNDIDFCFRVRASGMQVVYEPAIALFHYESRTRGHNVTASHVAWDEGELNEVMARWPSAVAVDPSRNPQWALGGVPFDGLREPEESEILSWIDRGGGAWRA